MSLPSSNLDAFVAVARTLSFSSAARALHVTQPALSQRIKNLESELGLTLFQRRSNGVVLTDSGEKLLRYCRVKDRLEGDVLTELTSSRPNELAGVVRVAAFSSVMRSAVFPALAPLLREHPKLGCDLLCREMDDLPAMLRRSEADFVVLDTRIESNDLVAERLGRERYVLMESTVHEGRKDVYLDHDPDDTMTARFWRHQERETPKYRRAFVDDIYGVLDGVASGLGRAVVPRHLLESRSEWRETCRIVPGYRAFDVEVWLHYFVQPYFPKLHHAVVNALLERCPKILK